MVCGGIVNVVVETIALKAGRFAVCCTTQTSGGK